MADPSRPGAAPFRDACRRVVAHLKAAVPLACWSVSRVVDGRQVHVWLADDAYGLRPGDSRPWEDTLCRHVVAGRAPRVAPDAMAVPRYAATAAAAGMRVGAYAAVPIRDRRGELYGTLCGFDPDVRGDDLHDHAPLLHLLAALLGDLVHVDRERDEAVVEAGELRWSARLDPRTGLTGRTAFLDALAVAARRDPAAGPRPALVLVGPAVLERVTDAHGHAAADRLLAEVGARLSGCLHPFDAVTRLDGEEFAVLLHDAADLGATGERVRGALGAPAVVAGGTVALAATAGAAVLDGAAPDELLARARAARRSARAGDPWGVPDPVPPGVPALREALRTGTVRAAYQPVVRLDDDGPAVIAYEALARWSHDGVAVPPAGFVPLAGRAGLLPALTDHMVELAAARLARWSAGLGHRRLQVGVNVPPALLLDPGFPDRVAGALRRHGLGPRQLVLEITEDALLDDLPLARSVARRLRALGTVLCLDDLGAGYSSLRHLRDLPLDVVKVDRAFVHDVDTDERAARFLGTVLTGCRDLGLAVVVEGVERPEQAEVLRALGARLAQGHLYGRPAAPEDVGSALPAGVRPPTP